MPAYPTAKLINLPKPGSENVVYRRAFQQWILLSSNAKAAVPQKGLDLSKAAGAIIDLDHNLANPSPVSVLDSGQYLCLSLFSTSTFNRSILVMRSSVMISDKVRKGQGKVTCLNLELRSRSACLGANPVLSI